MPKWNKRALRRATMTSKMGNMDYYKGRGARNEGTSSAPSASTLCAAQSKKTPSAAKPLVITVSSTHTLPTGV